MAKPKAKKVLKITAAVAAVALVAAIAAYPIAYRVRGDLKNVDLPDDFAAQLETVGGVQKAEGADVRVMSANLLVGYKSWGGTPVRPRAKQFVEVMRRFRPDVAALQEASFDWHACIAQNLANHEILHPQNNVVQKSLTTLIYNTETLDLLDSGRQAFSVGDGTQHRAVTWGVFETKADGKRFAVTSTHLNLVRDEETRGTEIETMTQQVNELLEIVNRIQTQYNCPVFCAGDYNAMENDSTKGIYAGSEIYSLLTQTLTDTKFIAEQQAAGSVESFNVPTWDHIFLKGDASVCAFRVLSEPCLQDMSDHFPVFADIALP